MHFDIHLRTDVRQRLDALAQTMREWEAVPRLDDEEIQRLRDAIRFFGHTSDRLGLRIAGVDGTGDFPAVTYGDSFVYVTLAQATCYASDPISGLREMAPADQPVFDFTWLPEDSERRRAALDGSFEVLAGQALNAVIAQSDYRLLKSAEAGRDYTTDQLCEGLIRPHAADAGNLAIQLRSAGEFGAALRMLRGTSAPHYALVDTTYSLPFVARGESSLFYEHLKRLCCVVARERSVGFFALSKSHGLPSVDSLETLAQEVSGRARGSPAEHWYLRVPTTKVDGWELSLASGRRLPPPGAVTYLVRFHRTTPTLRLDMDVEYWREAIRGATETATQANERRVFEDLDYSCHDQRCYGYPYPVKAGHDRASLTKAERAAFRKQIVEAAVRAGMKRSLFRDASIMTGHE